MSAVTKRLHPAQVGWLLFALVLVTLPHAGGVRMLGNLLGDPLADVVVGASVHGVFEPHVETQPGYTLLQWRMD